MTISSQKNFPAKLATQLRFLDRSCSAFDEGDEDEAVRIATIIRTIVHQTRASTSLLRHLGAEDIRLLSVHFEPPMPPGAIVIPAAIFLGFVQMGPEGTSYQPNLGQTEIRMVSVAEWWDERLCIIGDGLAVNRRIIVLNAANKDGGAHIDSGLEPVYERLGSDGRLVQWWAEKDGVKIELPSPNIHYVALRTMGWELLNSPELRGAAAPFLSGEPRSNERARGQSQGH